LEFCKYYTKIGFSANGITYTYNLGIDAVARVINSHI
jgi:hypothetical protein